MYIVVLILIGYFLGSIPFAYLISRIKGVNILKEGTGIPGAANVYRLAGQKYGAIVLLVDICHILAVNPCRGNIARPTIPIISVHAATKQSVCARQKLHFRKKLTYVVQFIRNVQLLSPHILINFGQKESRGGGAVHFRVRGASEKEHFETILLTTLWFRPLRSIFKVLKNCKNI